MANKDTKAPVRRMFQTNRRNRATVANPISVQDMQTAAAGCNYLLGRGNQLIPTFHMDIASGSTMPDLGGFTTYTTVLRVAPSKQVMDRYWTFSFFSDGQGVVEISVSGSQLNPTKILPLNVNQTVDLYREPVNSIATDVSGTQEVRVMFKVSSSTGDGVIPTRWSCFEAPRTFMNPLSQSQEGGVNEDSFRPGYPAYDSGMNQYESIAGLSRNVKLAQKQVRRAGLFTWAVPLDQSGNELEDFMIASSASSFEEKLKFPIMMQPTFQNVTSSDVTLMWVARQSTHLMGADIKFENGLGDEFIYTTTGSNPGAVLLETWYSGTLPIPNFNPNHDRTMPTGSVGVGFVPYITMSMRVTNPDNINDRLKLWTLQAFQPHIDLLSFTGSYTA